jgi:capsular exopolysaccharide synthesis family protein
MSKRTQIQEDPLPDTPDQNHQPQVQSSGHAPYGGHTPYGGTHYGGPYSVYGARQTADSALGTLSFSRVLRVLCRKWWLLLLFCGIAFGAVEFYLRKTPCIYESSALIELSVRRPRVMNQQGAVIEDSGVYLQSDEVFNTRLQKFQSRAIFDLAAAIYNQSNANAQVDAATLAGNLRRNAQFSLLRRTRLVRLTYRDQNPMEAMLRADAIASATEVDAIQENRIASDNAVTWLNTQVAAQRKELERLDQAMLEFRSTNMLDVLDNRKKTVGDSLFSFNRSLVDVESAHAMARDLLDTLAGFEAEPANLGKMPVSAPRAEEIRAAHEKWMAALAERDALLVRYTPQHPEVQARDKAVSLLHTQTIEAIRRSRETAKANVDLLEKQAESLRAKKAQQSKMSAELEQHIIEAKTKLQAMERERDVAGASYRGLLTRVEDARLAADENTANVKIVERPRLPDVNKPVSPKKMQLIVLGLMFGLAAGFGLALIVDRLEDFIVSPFDIEQDLGLPLVGSIPHVGGVRKRDAVALGCLHDKLTPFAESFAGLWSVLDSSKYRASTSSILVSSSMPAEGKTIVSSNLAATCALHGQRVLLIDFDLRRPRMANMFHMPREKVGLFDFLISKEDMPFDQLPFDTECPNLKVIGSRPIRGRTLADVMGGAKVRELIAWAKKNYEKVILDAPPLGIVSDAAVLAGFTDSVILVTRINKSRKRATAYTVGCFNDHGVEQVLTVVNDVNFRSGHHVYGRYHNYHYKNYVKSKE